MNKLGIDARLYSQTGVGTYLRNLLYYLHEDPIANTEVSIVIMNDEKEQIEKEFALFRTVVVPYKWHSFREQIGLLQRLTQEKFDLMHFTYFSYPYLYPNRFLSTIHDLTPLLFKTGKASTQSIVNYEIKYFSFKMLLANQVKRSERIITPTQTVKKQLVQTFGKQYEKKITPIYEGIDTSLLDEKADTKALSLIKTKQYFLYVGNFYPHKNVETLIGAFQEVPAEYGLVLVGPKDFFASRMQEEIQKRNLTDRITMLHGMDKSSLKALYQHALALVHPSLSEGFGLPLIEAMYLDVPIIASNIDVFNELLGSHYVSFDPYQANDIAEKIREFLVKKQKPNYTEIKKKYSFKKMTQAHVALYKELLLK